VWVFVTKFCEEASRWQLKRFISNLDGLGARGLPLEPLGPSARNGQELRILSGMGLVHELLNAQDTVLCSYFAQRSGERDASRSEDRNFVEEAFQGMDSFI
jgi:hypothetical protein